MERKRWVLILMALCLAFVFSVSSVEAQLCEQGNFCDRDGDTLSRDHQRCTACDGPIDTNDNSCDPDPVGSSCFGEDPEPTGTVEICHFKNILKHCEDPGNPGTFLGGGVRTVSDDQATIDRHEGHGDCIGVGSFIENPGFCDHHCIPNAPVGTVRCGP